MSTSSDPFPRQIHRKGNRVRRTLESYDLFESAEKYLEALRGFDYTEDEIVEYEGNLYEIEDRLGLSFNKKYVLADGVRTKKVPENDII